LIERQKNKFGLVRREPSLPFTPNKNKAIQLLEFVERNTPKPKKTNQLP
jgi:hypothetical protein